MNLKKTNPQKKVINSSEYVKRFKHFGRITYVEFKLSLSSQLNYRWQVLMWVISDLIQPLLLAILWMAAANASDSEITPEQMVSYYFAVAIVSKLTQDLSIQFVSESVERGEFSKYLTRPVNYLAGLLGVSLSIRTLRIIMLIPFILMGYLVLKDYFVYQLDLETVTLFIIAVIGGFFLNFLLGNSFALISFYIKQMTGLKALYVNLVSVLSGEYVPFALLSLGSLMIFYIQPFRYILSFPIEIIMGTLEDQEIYQGFGILVVWIVVMIFLYRYLYKLALKKYEAEGI